MKFSIITVCYNSVETLLETIVSVSQQSYPNIEYIVIDGGSTDGTLDIINAERQHISHFVSESDSGIYEAFNKGLALASGDIIGFLNADDVYASNLVLEKVCQTFSNSFSQCVYGDLVYINKERVVRIWKAGLFRRNAFRYGWMPPHPTFFALSNLYRQFGTFNTLFINSADYELMLRFLYKHKATASYIPEVLVKMRVGGHSNSSFKNRIRANREDAIAWKINELKPHAAFRILKPLRKLLQYIPF